MRATEIVYVVDDDAAVRSALESLLRSVGLAVESFGSAQAFLDRERRDAVACLVLDVRLPGPSGLDLQRELRDREPSLPIIFITGHGDIPMSVRAIKAGAVEFLPKPFRDQDLLDAIHLCLDRHRSAVRDRAATVELRDRIASLTPREREVMDLVVGGSPNKAIARALGISEVTVKIHRRQVMQKTHAKTFADLVRLAIQVRSSSTAS